jgi:hypothetical protein
LQKTVSILLGLVALIHLLPVAGAAGAQRLHSLYGLAIEDPNLLLLMQHRAVLFGLLGAFLLAAALRPAWTGPALVAGLISVASFLVLALGGGHNAHIARVVVVDWIALLCLLIAAALHLRMALKG